MKKQLSIPIWLICILFAAWPLWGVPLVIGVILLIIKIRQEKKRDSLINQLSTDVERMNALITPEMQSALTLQKHIDELSMQEAAIKQRIDAYNNETKILASKRNTELSNLDIMISKKKKLIISMDDEILVQEFGLYKPKYNFENSDIYKERLQDIRDRQSSMIKAKQAATGNTNWTVNGNAAQGRKMVSDMQKLLLRAFNCECDELIGKVKYNNYEASLKRMTSTRDAISKLGVIMGVSITNAYFDLKRQELQLALEYQIKKQEEKEALKAARAEMREQARLQKEIEEQRKKIEKEQHHYQKALSDIIKQLSDASSADNTELLEKKQELENQLDNIEISLKDIDYREANQRAGYVYIISNIGAFGPDVYKIGMTRRLDPMERIDELGDASVPFNFDVHAMIFTDDAPKLENALHKAFENRKVNMVNHRREFFRVTLDEIKQVIRENFDSTVEFVDVPDAEQYRITQRLLKEI